MNHVSQRREKVLGRTAASATCSYPDSGLATVSKWNFLIQNPWRGVQPRYIQVMVKVRQVNSLPQKGFSFSSTQCQSVESNSSSSSCCSRLCQTEATAKRLFLGVRKRLASELLRNISYLPAHRMECDARLHRSYTPSSRMGLVALREKGKEMLNDSFGYFGT